jgi:actin-related protein 3
LEAARRIKEQFCYVCADPAKEAEKLGADPAKYTRRFEGVGRTGTPFAVDVLRERFLGPELFFQPQLYTGGHSDWRTPLPEVIDACVQSCPIDCRRALYRNISLSGGTTMLKHFGARIQRDLKQAVDARTSGGVEVNVVSHPMQRYAVWFGGSLLGCSAGFNDIVVTREQYMESGPGIMRGNCVYREW